MLDPDPGIEIHTYGSDTYDSHQLLPVESIDGLYDTLEAVADVGHVGQPLHVHGDVLQRDEETYAQNVFNFKNTTLNFNSLV